MNTKTTKTAVGTFTQTDDLTVAAATGTAFTYKGVKPTDAIRHCKCDCGLQVVKKAIYRPGHDAKHVSALVGLTVDAWTANGIAGLRKAAKVSLPLLPSTRLRLKYTERTAKQIENAAHAETFINLANDLIDSMEQEDGEEG